MQTKPKIVILSVAFTPFLSGAEFFVKELVERLGNSYDFIIFTSRFKKDLAKTEKMPGCLVKRLGFGLPFGLDKVYFMLVAPLAALKQKPDILHAVMESYAGIALIIFKWFNKKTPAILTLQGGKLDDAKKRGQKMPACLWRKIHTAPDYITAISSFLAKRARELRHTDKNIFLIPNGFDVNEVPQTKNVEPFRIVCVGRLAWQKGMSYLIESLPIIQKDFPRAHLVLVGDGEEKEKLRGLAQRLNLEKSVSFLGYLPRDLAMREVSRSAVFVLPSLAEGLGNVFLEAQSCSTPVIGANVGGVPDIIQDGFNGFLIPPQNIEAIAQAVKKVFSDNGLAEKLAQNAKQTVQKFAWPNVISQVNDLYQTILKK